MGAIKHLREGAVSSPGRWRSKRFTNPVPHSEELAIVVIIEQVMIGMVSGTIYIWFQSLRHSIISIMYRHSPYVHKQKQEQVRKLMQRKNKWIDVIWTTLQETIYWVECMARERRRYLPSKNIHKTTVSG